MLPLMNLSKEDYEDLKVSGMLWEHYPEAAGAYEIDVEIPYKESLEKMFAHSKKIHRIWHKFDKWLTKTYGSDLYGEWVRNKIKLPNRKVKTLKYRHFNEMEFTKRLCGYEVMERIERYVKTHCKEIKIVYCDDETYSSSMILLIPHPEHGITVMFIPQNTSIQNRFFLYGNHFKMLEEEMEKMKYVYDNDDL